MKKAQKFFIIALIALNISTFLFPVGSVYAINCDQDEDGFIVIPQAIMNEVVPGTGYNENGNFSPAQWQDFFDAYKSGQLTDAEICEGLNFKKGAEPSRCDTKVIGVNSNVYDPAKQNTPLRGSQVNPGALDIADNGIDEDCDGQDSSLVNAAGATATDLGGLVDTVMTFLSRAVVVVSIAVMIWGGMLYATAAGEEAKISKARKAIIGAIIGLVVGLLAPTIVSFIVANLV